jgi:hypothetical protein
MQELFAIEYFCFIEKEDDTGEEKKCPGRGNVPVTK